METLRAIRIKGPVTVAYRRRRCDYVAIALQFDLVGIGKTKTEALLQLQKILDIYVREALKEKGRIKFFNPSPAEEWELPEKDEFFLACVASSGRPPFAALVPVPISKLRRAGAPVRSVQLLPAWS